jgi:hypothetical protein
MALAARSNYNSKVDPAFVGAVLADLPIKTATINDSMGSGRNHVSTSKAG